MNASSPITHFAKYILFVCFVSCFWSGVALSKAAAAPTAADGWKLLWKNKDAEARAAFRAALKQNPNDLEALRGLGTLASQEDDNTGVLQAWGRMIRQAPAHWSAAGYWATFVDVAEQSGRYPLLEQTAQEILKSSRVSPELRASARLAMADAADRAGLPASAEKQWAALGFIRQWNVIGPFDNVSRSGFEKAFPPEQAMSFKEEATGRDNARLRWQRLASVTRSGKCLLRDSLGDGEADVFYAATAVQSATEQTATLCFDPDGASKIFLNGTCVFADEKYHKSVTLVADPYQVPVTLHAGWNTLLVKIACKKDEVSEFCLRFTRPGGADLPALTCDPERAQSSRVTGAPASNTAEPASVVMLRKLPPTSETLTLIGAKLRGVEDYDGATVALRKALELTPDWGWTHWILSDTLSDDGQTNEAEAERDLARKANPRLIEAALNEMAEKTKARTPADRIHDLTALLAVNPNSESVHWALHDAYVAAKLTDKAFASARAAYNSAPGPAEALRYSDACSELDRKKESERVIAAAIHDFPADSNLQYRNGYLLEQHGQITAAIAAYRKALQTTQYPVSIWRHIASLYRIEKQWKPAIATYLLLRRMRPQDATDCSNLADAYRETGRKTEAIALYREAIRLQPSRVELRSKLQLVTGEKPVIDLGAATPSAPILAQAKALQPVGASAVMLLDENIVVIYPDYASISRYHEIIKVFDEAGVKHYTSFPTQRSTSSSTAVFESARLIKANGKIETIDISNAGDGVNFPSLAAGDVIDVTHRVEDYPTGGLGRHFWDSWYFDLENVPSRLSRYVMITPPEMEIQTQNHGTVAEPTTHLVNGWRVREWKRADIPALPLESMTVSRQDRGSWIDISTFRNWNEIVRWYQDLSSPLCIPDSAIKAQAQELTHNAATENDKIRALVAYVAQKIQYQSGQFRLSAYIPTEGKQVLREHYGDCKDKSALLVALLAAVNIPADMVLLSGREYGITPYLPSPRFTHAITRIHTKEGELWVDATADKMGFGMLPYPDQQVPALVIASSTSALSLSPADPVERNITTQTLTTKLEATGRLSGDTAIQWMGNNGWLMRSAFSNVSLDQYDLVLKGVASQLLANSVYEKGKLVGLKDPDAPMRIEISFHVDQYGSAAGNFLLAKLPWVFNDTVSPMLSDDKRRDDLEMASARGLDFSDVQMELPPGYEVQDLKPEVKGECAYGSYRFTYKVEGGKLIAHNEQRRLAFRIPASDQKTYRDYLAALRTEATRQMVLKKADTAK